jgi:hypothetical protein
MLDIKMKKIGIIGSRRRASDADFESLKAKFQEVYETGDEVQHLVWVGVGSPDELLPIESMVMVATARMVNI